MNMARNFSMVTCPSCQGTKKTTRGFTGGKKPCLTCYGQGEVEAYRVCQDCGHFRETCVCKRRGDVVRALPVQTDEEFDFGDDDDPDIAAPVALPPQEESVDKASNGPVAITGVTWKEKQQRWVAQIYRNGQNHFLGSFTEVEKANAIRAEAEGLHPSEYPALRIRHGVKMRIASAAPEPVEEAPVQFEAADKPSYLRLMEAIECARQADLHMKELRGVAEEAEASAQHAERAAASAWDEVARLLNDLAGEGSAIAQSLIGSSLLWTEASE